MGRTKCCREICALWLDAVRLEKGAYAADLSRRSVKAFLDRYGSVEVANVGPRELLEFRSGLAESFAVATANAYLFAAKRMVNWAAENGFRKPVFLSGVRGIIDEEDKPEKAWSVNECQKLWRKGLQFNRQAYVWTAIQYCSCARPSEVQRLILWKHGKLKLNVDQKGEGVFAFAGKTTRKNSIKRHLILCPEVLPLLDETEPIWTVHQTHWQGVNAAMGVGPHRFRHSSMSHLSAMLGVEGFPLVRLMAGHYAEWALTIRHYAAPQWEDLRKYGSMLAVNVPGLPCPAKETAAA